MKDEREERRGEEKGKGKREEGKGKREATGNNLTEREMYELAGSG